MHRAMAMTIRKKAVSLLSGGLDAEQYNAILGLRFRQGFDLGSLSAWMQIGIDWEHNFGDDQGIAINSFTSGDSFEVKGSSLDRNVGVIDFGVGIDLTESLSIGSTYIGRFSEDQREIPIASI